MANLTERFKAVIENGCHRTELHSNARARLLVQRKLKISNFWANA